MLFSCGSDNDEKFSGITKTDETGKVYQTDIDDWRPWQYVGQGKVPTSFVQSSPVQIAGDTVRPIDTTFRMSGYPNPCTDHFTLNFTNPETATIVFELYDKPGHLFRRYQPILIQAGLFMNSFDLPHWADDLKTEVFRDGIYRLYIKRYTSNGAIYQTYGDIQIDRKGY